MGGRKGQPDVTESANHSKVTELNEKQITLILPPTDVQKMNNVDLFETTSTFSGLRLVFLEFPKVIV